MKYICISIIIFFFTANISNAQEKSISIGNGGGFTGTTTHYKITSSGKVFKGKGLGEIKFTECSKIKKKLAAKYIQSVTEQIQSHPDFNHPGNLYYFIACTEDSTAQKITWGDAQNPVAESIQKIYQEINAVVSSLHYKPIK